MGQHRTPVAIVTNTNFPKIPAGAEGTPTDYDITAQDGDSVLVGKETLGAGIEGGHVYTTVEMKLDTVAPVISLTGDNPSIVYIGENYDDAGATAVDDVAATLLDSIVSNGAEIDTSTAGNHIVTYNVKDLAGNAADEVTFVLTCRASTSICPEIETIVVNGNKVTITLKTPDGVYDHQGVLIGEESFNENLPLEGVIIKPGLEYTSSALPSGTHQIHLAFGYDDKNLIVGESISTQVVILNTWVRRFRLPICCKLRQWLYLLDSNG